MEHQKKKQSQVLLSPGQKFHLLEEAERWKNHKKEMQSGMFLQKQTYYFYQPNSGGQWNEYMNFTEIHLNIENWSGFSWFF